MTSRRFCRNMYIHQGCTSHLSGFVQSRTQEKLVTKEKCRSTRQSHKGMRAWLKSLLQLATTLIFRRRMGPPFFSLNIFVCLFMRKFAQIAHRVRPTHLSHIFAQMGCLCVCTHARARVRVRSYVFTPCPRLVPPLPPHLDVWVCVRAQLKAVARSLLQNHTTLILYLL